MFRRHRLFLAPLLLLLLAACGTPNGTATSGAGGGNTAPTTAPARGTPPDAPTPAGTPVPAGQKPPRPVPDAAAVAAGEPLRAVLLAQLDEYAREVARCNSLGTPVVSCNVTGFEAVREQSPELAAYMSWYSFIKQCSSDGQGGYIATMMFIYSSPEELRDPGLLDVYVSGTPWCGQARPDLPPATTPPAPPATPATPTVPAGQRPPMPTPDPAAVAAGATLRATLLAQIDAAERRCAATPTAAANGCQIVPGQPENGDELNDYASWHSSIAQCASDGKGGYIFTLMLRASTPAELRDPALLDVYVANATWCGLTGSATVRPSARPATQPSTTPTPR